MTVDPRVEAALAYGRTRIHGNGRYVKETVLGVLAAADAVEGDQPRPDPRERVVMEGEHIGTLYREPCPRCDRHPDGYDPNCMDHPLPSGGGVEPSREDRGYNATSHDRDMGEVREAALKARVVELTQCLERVRVSCDNGSKAHHKIAFIREITGNALAAAGGRYPVTAEGFAATDDRTGPSGEQPHHDLAAAGEGEE